jgi:hypothetical protein
MGTIAQLADASDVETVSADTPSISSAVAAAEA